MGVPRNSPDYVGRFAPSPTGDLHFGSLVAALASFLQARSQSGKWLIRIEDVDPPREIPGSAERIQADLLRLGMQSDAPVLYQSARFAAYQAAIDTLLVSGQAYWCGCSRSDLPASGVYPGTCRHGLPTGRKPRSVRLRAGSGPIRFEDRVQGLIEENLATSCGDFVIRRADGLPAYQLAVAVDDAFQGVTEVVRGADLIDSTARQIHVQHCLGLATPRYAHIPVVLGQDGSKLGKRVASDPVRSRDATLALRAALAFLGHPAPELGLAETWNWARDHWSLARVPAKLQQPI